MSIPKENIESLLVDRAMGQLSPEAEALLEEYLQRNPALRESAHGVDRTIDAARQAFASDTAATHPLPALRRCRTFGSLKILRQLLPLAACLLIGFGAGFSLFRTEPPPPVKVVHTYQQVSPSIAPQHESGLTFWSIPANLKKPEPPDHGDHVKVNWNLSRLSPDIKGNL